MPPTAEDNTDLNGAPWNGLFVRSQIQVSFDTETATGHRMTEREVEDIFGKHALAEIADEGAYQIVRSPDEPATTLRMQRETLGLKPHDLAHACHLSSDDVLSAETPGTLTPVRILEALAQQLGLDEHRLGLGEGTEEPRQLGARLRRVSDDINSVTLTPNTVARLAEAAWVIGKQSALENMAGVGHGSWSRTQLREPMTHEPPWKQGYELARRTRSILGIPPDEPILGLRSLLDERSGIPLLSIAMNKQVAGAALANGLDRGIVVNTTGHNENVWFRRMTVAHELCHFLWDADESLDRLKVDSYEDLERDFRVQGTDDVEKRANAFAVEFLAPQASIVRVARQKGNRLAALAAISQEFGISVTAAGYHLDNSNHGNPALYGEARLRATPDDRWLAAENFTLDFFPMPSAPASRRGRFAQLVARAHQVAYLSDDSAAIMLRVPLEEFRSGYPALLGLAWTASTALPGSTNGPISP